MKFGFRFPFGSEKSLSAEAVSAELGAPIVAVFGSGRAEPGSEAYETARQLGAELARAGFAVATGGYGGTMEAVSRGAREAGGKIVGVTAEVFSTATNPWVEHEVRVKTWHERLFKLIELGAAYVVLPGGTGTLVELAVVWEWINKGVLPEKPIVILGDFWLPVVDTIPAAELRAHCIHRGQSVGGGRQLVEAAFGRRLTPVGSAPRIVCSKLPDDSRHAGTPGIPSTEGAAAGAADLRSGRSGAGAAGAFERPRVD